LSAEAGKVGPIISAHAFNSLSTSIRNSGVRRILLLFVSCCIAGAASTLLFPEVRARDPDEVLTYEIAKGAAQHRLA
ncbi:hypothetical protein C8F04DRAFT_976453, partial [Mycena alexandri]